MVVVVKYFGPTETKRARLRVSAFGHRARWFDRDFSLDPLFDAERVVREYAEAIGADPDTVRPLGQLSRNEEAFEVFFPL